jgi:Holliday junction resolvasome RuvABC endonuclease subunit
MKIVGIRCSNTDFSCAVLEGTQTAPQLLSCTSTSFPKGYEEHSLLHWFYQEISGVLSTSSPDGIAVKAAETMVKRSTSLELRIRIEGIALMAAAQAGCSVAPRKVKSTIAKDLGMKGKAKYLETQFDSSAIAGFDDYKEKEQEAILVAWSSL